MLLTYTHILERDDQWLFLPALKRIKRISSINKTGSFVGSEFACEDITDQAFGRYGYKWFGHAVLERLSIPPTDASASRWAGGHTVPSVASRPNVLTGNPTATGTKLAQMCSITSSGSIPDQTSTLNAGLYESG